MCRGDGAETVLAPRRHVGRRAQPKRPDVRGRAGGRSRRGSLPCSTLRSPQSTCGSTTASIRASVPSMWSPFVPLGDVDAWTLRRTRALGRRDGRRAVSRFPSTSMKTPRRPGTIRRLEEIRRGGLASAGQRECPKPGWRPGLRSLRRLIPTAGVTVIGARPPLVAYNVELATDRLDIARAIARIRATELWRTAVRQGHRRRARRPRHRAGLDESDRLSDDVDRPGL